jgi:hypothetical protein
MAMFSLPASEKTLARPVTRFALGAAVVTLLIAGMVSVGRSGRQRHIGSIRYQRRDPPAGTTAPPLASAGPSHVGLRCVGYR